MATPPITPEDRMDWAMRLTSPHSCHDKALARFVIGLLDMLTGTEEDLAAAEARAEKAEAANAKCIETAEHMRELAAQEAQRRRKAERELARLKGDGECPECGESYTLPEQACCTNWLVRQAEYGVIGTEMYLDDVKAQRDAILEALTPSTETKMAYMSEVKDDGRFVSWTAIKDIMAMIRKRAASQQAASVSQVSDKERCVSESAESETQAAGCGEGDE